jgi:hypothetical protein
MPKKKKKATSKSKVAKPLKSKAPKKTSKSALKNEPQKKKKKETEKKEVKKKEPKKQAKSTPQSTQKKTQQSAKKKKYESQEEQEGAFNWFGREGLEGPEEKQHETEAEEYSTETKSAKQAKQAEPKFKTEVVEEMKRVHVPTEEREETGRKWWEKDEMERAAEIAKEKAAKRIDRINERTTKTELNKYKKEELKEFLDAKGTIQCVSPFIHSLYSKFMQFIYPYLISLFLYFFSRKLIYFVIIISLLAHW